MKTIDKKTLIIAASTLLVGLLVGWFIFGGQKSNTHDKHQPVKTEVAAETIWTCSMHPQIRQSEPGDCPICGMDLIPLENDQNSEIDPMSITMSPTAMKLANVSTAFVEKTDPVKQVRLHGKVQIDERLVYSQSSHIPGRVEKLLLNFTGEYVSKGETIAHIYSPDLVSAQEELLEAQKIKETQPQLFAAAKEKLRNWKLSDTQIDEILKSGIIEEAFPIQADVSGYVTTKIVNLGDYVRKGEALYEIADLSKVWILFDVYESEILWIKKGDKVQFTVASFPGETFESTITYLDPIIDKITRVAKARIEYNNVNIRFKPEMFVSGVVDATLTPKSNSLVVPKSAVMWTGKRSVVYIKTESDQGIYFIMREVTLGSALGDHYIIENGLQVGDEIAVHGTFSIDAAAQLAGKPSMMSSDGGQVVSGHNHAAIDMGGSASQGKKAVSKHEVSKHVASKHVEFLSLSNPAKEVLQPLYATYLEWKDALTSDNVEKAKKYAVSMQRDLAKIEMNLFVGESHNIWMKFSNELKSNLQHVAHVSSIDDLRKAFLNVSITMVEMADTFKPYGKTLYVLHCPMAFNNKGADWLSSEKKITNPYFGKAMYSCGEVTKEIK